eukprot:RCo048643
MLAPDITVVCRVLDPDGISPARSSPTAPSAPAVGGSSGGSPVDSAFGSSSREPPRENVIQVLDSQTVRIPVVAVSGRSSPDQITQRCFAVNKVVRSPATSTEAVHSCLSRGVYHTVGSGHGSHPVLPPVVILSYGAEKTGKSWTLFGRNCTPRVWDGIDTEVGLVSRLLFELHRLFIAGDPPPHPQ